MSLFNAIDLWSTRCGEDETFGVESIICTDLDESGKVKIVVGSLTGLLRIYEPNCADPQQTSFKPSNLLLETQLLNAITQVVTGQLVSGSRAYHIAIAHPRSITVYNFASIPGSTEHGNQFELKIIYEHTLSHCSFQLIVGPFGGVKGRDFLCSYALDGTLTFFEQETFVHETQLPTFLLPTPMVFVPEVDSFVTLSADWCVESYRYQDLVNTARKKIIPAWSYNLGDTVIDVQTVKLNETFIVVLSEHNLTCFNAKGMVKFTKRLQYSSLCFHIYINEVTNELMILNVSDSGVLFVYERTTLRWSAKLPIIPISMCRANIGVEGALVLLSEQGELNCCYLGTKPTLFVAPPIENSITNYKNVGRKLEKLQEQIKEFNANSAKSTTLAVNEQEIVVTTKILPYDKTLNHCQLVVDLAPSRPLNNVHVTFEADVSFTIKPESYTLSTLCEKAIVNASIEIDDNKDIIPTSLEVTTIVSYFGNITPCMIRKRCSLSPRFVLTPCTTIEEKNSSKITVSCNKPPLPLTVIFQEFRGDKWSESGNNDEVAGFCLNYNTEKKCTVALSKLKHGYEFSTSSIPMLYLLLKHVTTRCKSHKGGVETEDKFIFDCKNVPKNELMKAVERHVSTRNEIRNLLSFLEKLSSQYRLIQRRFLIKLKDKTSTPMTALQTLYTDIYRKLLETIRSVEEQQRELIIRSNELQAAIDLTLDLITINSSIQSSNVEELRQAMALTSLNLDSQGWEERTYANLIHLLKTVLSNSSKDQLLILPPAEKIVNEPTQLWKLLCTAFDRITDGKFSLSQKLDQTRMVTPIMEDDEIEEEPKGRKFRFLKHQRLLSKRQSYSVHDNVIDQLNEIE